MPTKKSEKGLTPKQKNAMKLLLTKVADGQMTVEAALKEAGYSEATAKQQKSVIDSLRKNSVMHEALEKAGVTEDLIATKLMSGLVGHVPKDTMIKFLKLATELKDAFPAKKQITAEVGVEELLDEAENEVDYAEWDESSAGA